MNLLALFLVVAIEQICLAPPEQRVEVNLTCVRSRNDIAAAPQRRAFLWTRGDEAVVGVVGAGEVVGECGGVAVDIATEGGEAVTVDVEGVSAVLPVGTRRVHLPAGAREVRLAAPHHRGATVALPAGGRVVLRRLPVISGSVVDGDHRAPIAGASVTATPDLLAVTNAAGEFALEVDGDWPEALRVRAPGRAEAIVELPEEPQTTQLRPVVLRRGGVARIAIVHRGGVKAEVTRGTRNVVVAARTLRDESDSEMRIAGLAPGTYRLRIYGSGPLQQYGTTFTIREGEETAVDAMIVPQRLILTLRRGNAPVGPAALELMHLRGGWRGTVFVAADGTATEELWQNGEVAYASEIGGFGDATIAAGDEVKLVVDLPMRRIAGTVVDAEKNTPVGGAGIDLEIVAPASRTLRRTKSDASGRFTFESVDVGTATLTVTAGGYLTATEGASIGEADQERTLALRLHRALEVPVTVIDHRGLPADAVIIDAATSEQWTANGGTATIPFRRGETKTLFAVPRGGSFAVARIAASAGPSRIAVPAGVSSIRIYAAPLQSLELALRYNGELLPQAVIDALYRVQGFAPVVRKGEGLLANVPPGVYELLPVGVSVAAQPGENIVSLTFAR